MCSVQLIQATFLWDLRLITFIFLFSFCLHLIVNPDELKVTVHVSSTREGEEQNSKFTGVKAVLRLFQLCLTSHFLPITNNKIKHQSFGVFFKPKKINMIASANSWFSINKSYSFNSVSLFIFPLRFHTPPTVAQCPTNRCYHTVSELLSVFYCKKYIKN